MELLVLTKGDEEVQRCVLATRPIEIGRASNCDLVVADAHVAERQMLVHRLGGTVVWYPVETGGSLGDARPLPLQSPVPVRGPWFIERRYVVEASSGEGGTEPLRVRCGGAARWRIFVGSGRDARRATLERKPITVGTDPANDLALVDRTVSARHCRIEPAGSGVLVRDLGSKNGTWVDGLRIVSAFVDGSSRIRVGRTDLWLVPHAGDIRGDDGLVAASPAMMRVLSDVDRFAKLRWPVLILGESGAGKEGIARRIHDRSERAQGPFVSINAGALAPSLVETELFGHERGSFTGAVAGHRGVFEQAQNGTLFLDEIGELPLEVQARLLRVLEEGTVRRVGTESAKAVDVRIVAATHRDLRGQLARESFRRDLYYRLSHVVVEVPPLRERPEDVCALAEHFLARMERDVGARRLTDEAVARMLAHPWPGNARELRNVLGAAAVSSPSAWLDVADIDRAIERVSATSLLPEASEAELRAVVTAHKGNVSAAARALGMARSTLRDRLRTESAAPPQRSKHSS